MNLKATLCEKVTVTDKEGFTSVETRTLANMRVLKEGRHGSVRWANLAAFSEATDLFQFRIIPNVNITPGQIILVDNKEYTILSVENVRGRNMYLEVLAKRVEPTHG